MGHGTHWEAVLKNLKEDFALAIDIGIQKGAVIGKRRYRSWIGPLGKQDAEITLIQGAKSGFGALGIVVSADSKTYLHSAYPVAANGKVHRLRVLEIHESSFGLEAYVTAQIGQARINFFEPYYALHSDLYTPNSDIDVSLAGIVYQLSVPNHGRTVIHPEIGTVHLDGAAALIPIQHPAPSALPANGFGLAYVESQQDGPGFDDYRFFGPVKSVESEDFLSRPALRLTATLIRIQNGATDVDIDLCVLDDKISGGQRPLPGGDVTGVLWLQGIAAF